MGMVVREIRARSILSPTGIPGSRWCLNPYLGCAHACRYCYADFMRRYSGHVESWGSFVDVKVDAPALLLRQLRKAERGRVFLSSVTDPYQPLEARYRLARRCLEILRQARFPTGVLTKSPLVLRDLDLFREFEGLGVGITIGTDDERCRRLLEPGAPPLEARLEAVRKLVAAGVDAWVFVAPLLPCDPDRLVSLLAPLGVAGEVDRMNYPGKTAALFRSHGLGRWLERDFVEGVRERLRAGLERHGAPG
jgi:DNA repair photolyase